MNVTFLRKLETNKNTIRNRVQRAGMFLSMLIHLYHDIVMLGRFIFFVAKAFIFIIVYSLINNLPTCLVVKHGTQT